MPFYDYYCENNKETVTVRHSISKRLKTWGEVCSCAERDPGTTPVKTPVIRLMGGMPFVPKLKGLDKDMPSSKLDLS